MQNPRIGAGRQVAAGILPEAGGNVGGDLFFQSQDSSRFGPILRFQRHFQPQPAAVGGNVFRFVPRDMRLTFTMLFSFESIFGIVNQFVVRAKRKMFL